MLLCWRGEFSWPVTLESSLKSVGNDHFCFMYCRWAEPVSRIDVIGCCLKYLEQAIPVQKYLSHYSIPRPEFPPVDIHCFVSTGQLIDVVL